MGLEIRAVVFVAAMMNSMYSHSPPSHKDPYAKLTTTSCIINPTDSSQTSCCKIGSTCGSKCSDSQQECNATTTITSAGSTITSVSPACCGRQCPQTSMFGCPQSLGNGCCSYGSTCAPERRCISTIVESSSQSAIVTQIPDGCTTSQIKCESSLGGGCCAVTQSCVKVDEGARCAEATITPTGSGLVAVEGDKELGAGAKAGISVGVIVVAGLVIGGVTYFCLRKRRRRSEMGSGSVRPAVVPGAVIGSGGGGGGRDMSDLNSDVYSRPGGLPGVAQDYFGPEPQMGPYSDAPHDELSPGTTPGVGERGGVPVVPHGPGDIAVPVEIDSGVPGPGSSPSPQPGSAVPSSPVGEGTPRFLTPSSHVAVAGTFELYGSSPDVDGSSPYVPSPGTQGGSPFGEGPSPSPGEGRRG